MTKKLLVITVALAFIFGGKVFAEAPKAKQAKVVETRINEADMDRLASAVNRAVKEAVIAKQGPSGFEYMAKRMKPPKNEKWKGKWNDLGSEGWEAIDHFENVYIFKRIATATSYSSEPTRLKPAASPAQAEPTTAPAASKEDEKAAKDAEKAAKKAAKEKEKTDKKAAKDAEKAAKKAEKEKKKAEKKAK